MNKPLLPATGTLQLSLPFGTTLLFALLLLALMVVTAEAVARLPWVRENVPVAIGGPNGYFDQKIGELEYLIDQEDPIDCIFVGSSVVNSSIIPGIFETHYYQQTGETITCYNLGVPGATAYDAAILTRIAIDRYHPRLIVYGFTLHAFSDAIERRDRAWQIGNVPWVRYMRGEWDLEGWIVDHSRVFRHYLALRDWPEANFRNPVGTDTALNRRGFNAYLYTTNVFVAPDDMVAFQTGAKAWIGLERLVAAQSKVQMLLIEMPVPDHTVETFDGGPANYQAIVDDIAAYAADHSVPIWQTRQLDLIPPAYWAGDAVHMQSEGAIIFSQWLGVQVGQAVLQGDLAPLTNAP